MQVKEETPLSDKSCKYCYYNDFCSEDEVCDNYAPIGDDAENASIDELIEQRREEFRRDFFEYIEDRMS